VDEVCFTSGGTESDNLAILGVWREAKAHGRNAVIATPIEHKAILGAVHEARAEGAEERMLDVDINGTVTRASWDAKVSDDVAIASVMWVNNEIGTIQPVVELAADAKSKGIVFHTDAVQAFGKVTIDASTQAFDLLSISGHKIGAPKGIGALYIRRGTKLQPLMHGGMQDRGRRPGTENVAYAVALATAAELTVAESEKECGKLRTMRDRLESAILASVPDAIVHGRGADRAPHVLDISVPGTDSESLLMVLDLQGIAASGGSACQSGSVSPSHVLTAIGVSPDIASAAVRMSLGALTTDQDIERVAVVFPALVKKARQFAAAS
jgi:cysteine desulfurase